MIGARSLMRDSRIVLRYDKNGQRIQRLPIDTIFELSTFVNWYNETSRLGLLERLNKGESCNLPDDGWIELEKHD